MEQLTVNELGRALAFYMNGHVPGAISLPAPARRLAHVLGEMIWCCQDSVPWSALSEDDAQLVREVLQAERQSPLEPTEGDLDHLSQPGEST